MELRLVFTVAVWYIWSSVYMNMCKHLISGQSSRLGTVSAVLAGQSALPALFWLLSGRAARESVREMFLSSSWVLHLAGNLCALLVLAFTSTALTQVLKATEPLFCAGILRSLLSLKLEAPRLAALLLTVGGAMLAAWSDVSFSWLSVAFALASNVSFAARNVSLKNLNKQQLSPADQLGAMSLLTAAATFPVAAAVQLSEWNLVSSASGMQWALLGGLAASHLLYNLASLRALEMVDSALTHSVLNCLKRAVVICSGLLLSHHTPSPLNMAGSLFTLTGVFLFGQRYRQHSFSFRLDFLVLCRCATLLSVPSLLLIQLSSARGTHLDRGGGSGGLEFWGFRGGNSAAPASSLSFPSLNFSYLVDTPYLDWAYGAELSSSHHESCLVTFGSQVADNGTVRLICAALLGFPLDKTGLSHQLVTSVEETGLLWEQTHPLAREMNLHLVLRLCFPNSHSATDVTRFGASLAAQVKSNIPTYFWEGVPNWGDTMSIYLIEKLSNMSVSDWRRSRYPVLLPVGSTLSRVPKLNASYTWGPGFIEPPKNLARERKGMCSGRERMCPKEKENVFGVRGPRSQVWALRVFRTKPAVTKDPALLISTVLPLEKTSEHPLCVIPHYVDQVEMARWNSKHQLLLLEIKTAKGHSEAFPRSLVRCARVLSSSLHGLIASHAYGIPAAAIRVSGKVKGEDFKFHDYYQSIGLYMQTVRHHVNESVFNPTALRLLVDRTPQPRQPICARSIFDRYLFPVNPQFQLRQNCSDPPPRLFL